jgi:hypothetical protein
VIKAGTADHFEFICGHPDENLGAVAEGRKAGLAAFARERSNARRELTKESLRRAEASGFEAVCVPWLARCNANIGPIIPRIASRSSSERIPQIIGVILRPGKTSNGSAAPERNSVIPAVIRELQ